MEEGRRRFFDFVIGTRNRTPNPPKIFFRFATRACARVIFLLFVYVSLHLSVPAKISPPLFGLQELKDGKLIWRFLTSTPARITVLRLGLLLLSGRISISILTIVATDPYPHL